MIAYLDSSLVIKILDALHLATALSFAEKRPDEKILVFLHDEGMNRCASVLGFGVPLACLVNSVC